MDAGTLIEVIPRTQFDYSFLPSSGTSSVVFERALDIVDFYRARLVVMVHDVSIQNGSFVLEAKSAMPSPQENSVFTVGGSAALSITLNSSTSDQSLLVDDVTDAGPYLNLAMAISQTTAGQRLFADISVAMLLRAGG